MTTPALESEYFGPILGHQTLYQMSWQRFHENCSSSAGFKADNTGQRLYAGAHVAIRFLCSSSVQVLSKGTAVVELGCGTGCFGLMAMKNSELRSLLLTDGTESTLSITHLNLRHLVPDTGKEINICRLEWGLDDQVLDAKRRFNSDQAYDVVIGCELMYYLTDIPSLLFTALQLTNYQGIFIHAHLFRRPGQESELIEYLHKWGWSTIEVRGKEFIDEKELSEHAEWTRVRALISAPMDKISELLLLHPSWCVFQPDPPAYTEEEEEEEKEGIAVLFS